MLIYLDNSICQAIEAPSPNSEIIESLEDLASVIRSGSHLILGDFKVLKALASLSSLGLSARAAFKASLNKFPQQASALKHVSTYTKITANNQVPTRAESDGKKIITIPLSLIQRMNLKAPVEIIFEELNDSSIYEIISRWYLKSFISPGFINRNYRSIHGGGGRTHVVYTDAQNRNDQFCLCITDSDKKFPTDEFGQTSKDVRASEQTDKVLSYHMDLDFHEVENLVPLNFLLEKCKTKPSQDLVSQIKSADQNGNPEAKLFWDYKKGFKLSTLKSLDGGWTYWKRAFNLQEIECSEKCKTKDCTCEILKPWPEKRIVKDEITNLADMDPSECRVLHGLWTDIGKVLISWSISGTPKVA